MTERERAHPPSLPTSPTEKTPPPNSPLSANGDFGSKDSVNDKKESVGLDPEGQETVNDSNNEEDNAEKDDKVEDVSEKVCKPRTTNFLITSLVRLG